jgi:tetratricopeptide (TPR) repeat protein
MLVSRLLAFGLVLASTSALPCGWYYATFAAETGTLPCVEVVALGVEVGPSRPVLERSLDVAELASGLFPRLTAPLDARANLLLALGALDAGVEVARQRATLEPRAYASHANLGTALTLAGDLDGALLEVQAALALDPQAHFGQERLHLQLLEYLVRLRGDPSLAEREDLLGLSPTTTPDAGESPLARDALVAMLGLSGARGNPHLSFALGNVLRLEGKPRLAFLAWRSALRAKHPSRSVVPVMQAINAEAHDEWLRSPEGRSEGRLRGERLEPNPTPLQVSFWMFDDRFAGLWWSAERRFDELQRRRLAFLAWEKQQLALGLPFWTEAGMRLAAQQERRLGLRCPASTPEASGPTPTLFPERPGVAPTARALAWLSAVESVTDAVNERDGCEAQGRALTKGFGALDARATDADRESLLAPGPVRQRWLDAFDRLAVVLARCAPKAGDPPRQREWLEALTRAPADSGR